MNPSALRKTVPLKRLSSIIHNHNKSLTTSSLWSVVDTAESLLTAVHVQSALPWWAVIAGTTVVLRGVLTLPLAVHQQKVGARMELLRPLLKEYSDAIMHNVVVKCRRQGLPVEEANRRIRKEVRKMTSEVYSQEKCHPMKAFLLPWCQIPLWIVLSFAIRNLAGAFPGATSSEAIMASLSSEGLCWFADLTAPDQYYVLPLVLGVSNLLNIEIHSLKRSDPSRTQRIFTNSFRILSLSAGVVSTQLPTALTLYWSVSSVFSILQNLLLMSPKVKRSMGVPQTTKESKTPYSDLLKMINSKGRKFLERQR